jgi:hypothetical protein
MCGIVTQFSRNGHNVKEDCSGARRTRCIIAVGTGTACGWLRTAASRHILTASSRRAFAPEQALVSPHPNKKGR